MCALSIRQPYAELILRGEKTIEYRSRPTRIIGERFYIYAARPKTRQEPEETEALTLDSADKNKPGQVGFPLASTLLPSVSICGSFFSMSQRLRGEIFSLHNQ